MKRIRNFQRMLIDHLRWWRKVQGVRRKVGFIRKLEVGGSLSPLDLA
jgi:hypothetical protein